MTIEDRELTRKQRREQAREERRAAEAAAAAAAARRRRLMQLGGAGVVAIIVIAIAIAISSGGGGNSRQSNARAAQVAQSGSATGTQSSSTNGIAGGVAHELNGIPQSGATLGSASAPVSIEEFGDLQCPICQQFSLGSFRQLASNDLRRGNVKITFHSLETATHDPNVFGTQQLAAEAAGLQNKEWNYIDAFYRSQGTENSGYVTEQFLVGLARLIPGLNVSTWLGARSSNKALVQQVNSDASVARSAGYNSTPTLVISGPKGKRVIIGPPSYSQLEQLINTVA